MEDNHYGMLTTDEGFSIDDVNPSWGLYAKSAFKEGWMRGPIGSVYRMYELDRARSSGNAIGRDEAQRIVDESGLDIKLGGSQETKESLDLLMDRARTRETRALYIERYNPGIINQLGIGLLAGATDPVNIAASFIPVVGQARYAAMLKGATGLAGRTGIRAGVGAVEGMVGMSLVEPLNAFASKQEGLDYTFDEFLTNIAFGGVLGGGLHTGFGAIGEVIRGFPYKTREAALKTAVSDIIEGQPVRAGDILAHRTDVRLLPPPEWRNRAEILPTKDGMTVSIKSADGKKTVGIGNVRIGEDGRTASIQNVRVNKAYRDSGIEVAIYDTAKKTLAERGLRGVKLVPSETMNAATLRFWREYDPASVADDPRLNRHDIEAYAEVKHGLNTEVEYVQGRGVIIRQAMREVERLTKQDLKDRGIIPTLGGKSKYYDRALNRKWAARDILRDGQDPKIAARNKVEITEDVDALRRESPDSHVLKALEEIEKNYDPAIVQNMMNTGWARQYLSELRRLSKRVRGLPEKPILPEGFKIFDETDSGYQIVMPSDNPRSPFAKASVSLKDGRGEISNVWVRDDVRKSAHPEKRWIAKEIYDYVEKRLASEGRRLAPSSNVKEAGFRFWSKFRPEDVAHDLRSNKGLVAEYAKKKFGKRVRIEYREGGGTATVFRGGNRLGDITNSELWEEGVGLPRPKEFKALPKTPKQTIQEHVHVYARAMSERLENAEQAMKSRLGAYRDQILREDVKPEVYENEFSKKSDAGDPEALQHIQKIRAEAEKHLDLLPKDKADAIREQIKKIDEDATDLETVIGRVTECFFQAGMK